MTTLFLILWILTSLFTLFVLWRLEVTQAKLARARSHAVEMTMQRNEACRQTKEIKSRFRECEDPDEECRLRW